MKTKVNGRFGPMDSKSLLKKLAQGSKRPTANLKLWIARRLHRQLGAALLLCFAAAAVVYGISGALMGPMLAKYHTDYTAGKAAIDEQAQKLAEFFNQISAEEIPAASGNANPQMNFKTRIANMMADTAAKGKLRVLAVDANGTILYKAGAVTETAVDLRSVIGRSMKQHAARVLHVKSSAPQTYSAVYPAQIGQTPGYVIAAGTPKAVMTRTSVRTTPWPLLLAAVVFASLFYIWAGGKMERFAKLSNALDALARGRSATPVSIGGEDEFAVLAARIDELAARLQIAAAEEAAEETARNDLVANAAYDLRTPLTLLKSYLRLVHNHSFEDDAQALHYLKSAGAKADELQNRVESLFEYAKLSGSKMTLSPEPADLPGMIRQIADELLPEAGRRQVNVRLDLPEKAYTAVVDHGKFIRLFENLMLNAFRHASKSGRVHAGLEIAGREALLFVESRGTALPEEKLRQLQERLYRPGSPHYPDDGNDGMGLAVASHIVQLHGWTMDIGANGDLLQVSVRLPGRASS